MRNIFGPTGPTGPFGSDQCELCGRLSIHCDCSQEDRQIAFEFRAAVDRDQAIEREKDQVYRSEWDPILNELFSTFDNELCRLGMRLTLDIYDDHAVLVAVSCASTCESRMVPIQLAERNRERTRADRASSDQDADAEFERLRAKYISLIEKKRWGRASKQKHKQKQKKVCR